MASTFFGQLAQRNPPRVSEPASGRISILGALLVDFLFWIWSRSLFT